MSNSWDEQGGNNKSQKGVTHMILKRIQKKEFHIKNIRRYFHVFIVTLLVTPYFLNNPVSFAREDSIKYTDIKGHWAEDMILKATEKGIVDGFPDGTFRPDAFVTGDQFLAMFFRAFSESYTDNNGQKKRRFDQKWIEEMFHANEFIARGLAYYEIKGGFNFEPAKSGYWAKPYLDLYYSIFRQDFDPMFPYKEELWKEPLTRERAALLLVDSYQTMYMNDPIDHKYRDFILKRSGIIDVNDFTFVPSFYAAELMILGIMQGWDNRFYPQRKVTRAEALTLALRFRYPELREPLSIKPSEYKYYFGCDGRYYIFNSNKRIDLFINIKRNIREAVNKNSVNKRWRIDDNCLSYVIFENKVPYYKAFMDELNGTGDIRDNVFGVYFDRPYDERRDGLLVYLKFSEEAETVFSRKVITDILGALSNGKGEELYNKINQMSKTYNDGLKNGLGNRPVHDSFDGNDLSLEKEADYYLLDINYNISE